jgi:hypothetical protein
MAYTFTDATILGYQVNRNYLGEGLFSINTTKNVSIEGIFLNPTATEGVRESIQKISGFLTGITNVYDSIVINDYNLGSGKITSISFPEGNPIRLGRYIYDIEILESGDFSFAPNDTIYGSFLSTGTNDKILNLEENLNFENEDNGDYSYNHDINIQYYEDGSDIISKAKDFAYQVFNDTLEVGLIGQFSGFYNVLKNKKNYFSENYDIVNKRCNFSKRILINKNFNTNYTTSLSHNLTFDGNGKITVTENGTIKALDNSLQYTADNYFNIELSNSYLRCQDIFNTYTEKYGLGQKDSLFNQPFTLGKTSDIFNNSLEYNVSYVNDPAFEGNIINTYNINISKDIQDIINYSEEGQLIQVGQIGSISGLSLIKSKYLTAKSRNNTRYPNLKLKNSTFSDSNLIGKTNVYVTYVQIASSFQGLYLVQPDLYNGKNYYVLISNPSYTIYFSASENRWKIAASLGGFGPVDGAVGDYKYPWFAFDPVYGVYPVLENTYNNNFSYSIEKTSDNSIIEGNPYYKSLSFEINDTAPYDLYKEYIIANKNPKNVLFLFGNQVEIGNRSVTINGTLVRPTNNPWSTPITLPLNDLKSKSISGALDLVSDEAYIDNIAYNYDSDYNFSFSLDLKYLRTVG